MWEVLTFKITSYHWRISFKGYYLDVAGSILTTYLNPSPLILPLSQVSFRYFLINLSFLSERRVPLAPPSPLSISALVEPLLHKPGCS